VAERYLRFLTTPTDTVRNHTTDWVVVMSKVVLEQFQWRPDSNAQYDTMARRYADVSLFLSGAKSTRRLSVDSDSVAFMAGPNPTASKLTCTLIINLTPYKEEEE
jgi:hypothetical protein